MSNKAQFDIHVCALADVDTVVASTNATHLVSVLQTDLIPKTPSAIAPENHYKLGIDDIEAPFGGLIHADVNQIETLCAFVDTFSRESLKDAQRQTLVIHCYAGVSRSTATAFLALCALNPHSSEVALAKYLRSKSPSADPNRLIVSLGDQALNRNGRMVSALRAMGRAEPSYHAQPFSLKAHALKANNDSDYGSAAA